MARRQRAYDRLGDLFSEVEVANLTVLIGLINLWNRVAVGGGFHIALSGGRHGVDPGRSRHGVDPGGGGMTMTPAGTV